MRHEIEKRLRSVYLLMYLCQIVAVAQVSLNQFKSNLDRGEVFFLSENDFDNFSITILNATNVSFIVKSTLK